MLPKVGEDTYEKCPEKYTQHCWLVECRGAVSKIFCIFSEFFFVFFALKWASLPTRVCSQVGETVFHVCFLMGTPIHMHLAKVEHNKKSFIKMLHPAKRMLKHFPLLLNDIYLSEEYYGENVLHMAAVAEVIMANYRIEKCCNCETSPGSFNCKMAP